MSVNGRLEKFWLQELTKPAFEDWLENEDAPVVVIGLGAIEQHGPHLPLGTDSFDAMAMINEVAKSTNSVCVLPTWIGYSPHHMGFKGTITFSEDTYLNVLLDTMSSLAQHGVKRFVFYSGHGGNSNIMNLAMQMAKQHLNVMTFYPRGPRGTETQRKNMDQMRRHNDLHSGVGETNAALYLFPDLVEMWRLDDWEPTLDIDPKLRGFMDPDRDDYELISQVVSACREPRTDDFSRDGIYGFNDPRESDPEEYKRHFEERSQFYVDFINLWKTIPLPPAFRD